MSTGSASRSPVHLLTRGSFPLSGQTYGFESHQCFVSPANLDVAPLDLPLGETLPFVLHVTYNPPMQSGESRIRILQPQRFEMPWASRDSFELVEERARTILRAEYEKIERLSVESRKPREIRRRGGTCSIRFRDQELEVREANNEKQWIDSTGRMILNFASKRPYAWFELHIYWDYSAYPKLSGLDDKWKEFLKDELTWRRGKPSPMHFYLSRPDIDCVLTTENIEALLRSQQRKRPFVEDGNFESFLNWAITARAIVALYLTSSSKFSSLKKCYEAGLIDSMLPLKSIPSDQNGSDSADFLPLVERPRSCQVHDFQNALEYEPLDDDTIVPIEYDGRLDWIGGGVSANVFRVKIHRDHQRFSSERDKVFAMKCFTSNEHVQRSFEKESRMLAETRKLSHDHIVAHLAIWTQGAKSFILFHCAQRNLEDFMSNVEPPKLDRRTVLWFLGQLYGLSDAISCLHNLAAGLATSEDITAYHHDLKPENILLFVTPEGEYIMKISDFGSGDYHIRSGPNKVSHGTETHHGTATYESPDHYLTGRVSRPYDMWSLGCVYLELFVWLFMDCSQVSSFATERSSMDYIGFWSQRFWKPVEGLAQDDTSQAKLKDVVEGKLKYLEINSCHGKQIFVEIIAIIRELFETDADKRLKAADLNIMMDRRYSAAKDALSSNPDCYI